MPYDAEATRKRLLDAAVEEFAARGWPVAGWTGSAAAAANKRAIYDYFGGKEGLFDAALRQVINDLNAANPLLADDLPEYAGRLFDYLHAHPEAVRMTAWWRLEWPQVVDGLEPEWFSQLRAFRPRPVGSIDPVDLVVLVLGMANAWFLSASVLVRAVGEDPDDPERLAAHRAMVVAAVRRLTGA